MKNTSLYVTKIDKSFLVFDVKREGKWTHNWTQIQRTVAKSYGYQRVMYCIEPFRPF